MSTTVTYKGSTLTTATNQTRTLKTAGKYMEDDVTVTDVTSGGSVIGVIDTEDVHGGIIREITAVSLENDTVTESTLLNGVTAHNSQGDPITGTYVPQGEPVLQTKSVNPTESAQQVKPDSGYDGLSQVDVGAISSTYVGSGVTRNPTMTVSGRTVTAPIGYYSEAQSASVAQGSAGTPTATKGTVSNNSVSVTPSVTNTTGYISGGTKTGTAVSVSASELVSGNKSISQNGNNIDVTNFATVSVNVGGAPTLQTKSKSYTPTETQQTESVVADSGYDGLEEVNITVSAIPSDYVGSGVAQRDETDLTASGATVTVPSGYYAEQETKSIASGSVTAPNSISGTSATVSAGTNTLTFTKTVSVTPNVTSAGYISSGTAGNSSVSLTANVNTRSSSDLTVSGATVTAPAGYYATQATKSVASGAVTAPSSISGTSASVSTGTNTLTLTKTVSVTPNVTTAGYISSGTAGNSSVSLTASVTTQGATTYHPSTTQQTISGSRYLTGTQTIAPVTTTNLSAGNILNGVTIKVGDASDDDCVASVTGNVVIQNYYTGSSAPSSSLGSNGDLYLQA